MTRILITLCCFLFSATLLAQEVDYAATKEKVYLHTSHVFFKPGEQVFFKLYVVNARSQTPSYQSHIVYAELIDPSGKVVQKANYQTSNGYAEGAFDFSNDAVGGIYKIKAYTTFMRNEEESTWMVREITLQKIIAPRLLMKLDMPGKGFGPGDEVTADFSVRNLQDEPIAGYPASFVVSLAGTPAETTGFQTDQRGKATLRFRLPSTLTTNDGLLNVNISYRGYTESVSRSIPIVLNHIDLQFMPEGGTLVAGIPTTVAFKALNEFGKAADIKGIIQDNRGNTVTTFESYHMGMGQFAFTPAAATTYQAIITSPVRIDKPYPLPTAAAKGVVMNLTRVGKQVIVSLKTTAAFQARLTGQFRGATYYTGHLSLQAGENKVTIDETLFPAGITQFTLYQNRTPLAERLVFLNEGRNLQVSITTDKQEYLPREKVTLTLHTKDENGQPLPANLSLAVMDDKLWTMADDKQDHILSWLLMSTELKGTVEEPTFYFKKEEPKAIPALDLVMLTHGYRYYEMIDYVQQEGRLKYYTDLDNILSGTVVDRQGKPVAAHVYLVNQQHQGNTVYTRTGADGQFYFSQLTPGREYYLMAQPMLKKEKVTIQVLQNGIGYNPLSQPKVRQDLSYYAMTDPVATGTDSSFAALPIDRKKKDQSLPPIRPSLRNDAHLDEVVVVGYGVSAKRSITGSISNVQANALNLTTPIQALQGRMPGIQITAASGNTFSPVTVRIRGQNSLSASMQPLFVVNGVPMEQLAIQTLNPNDIESITVLKDAEATSIYGSRGSNGVIIIEAKKFRAGKLRIDFSKPSYFTTLRVQASGAAYTLVKRFYAPRYNSTITEERKDFRETIYWNAVVQTDREGKATVAFYNSDASTTFRAIAEGIGYNGLAGRTEATYAAQAALQVDAKIPPYLTVEDQALIPVTIRNNSRQLQQLTLHVEVTAHFQAGHFPPELVLAQDSTVQVLVPVQAIQASKGVITLYVRSQQAAETISLPIEADNKGFEVIATFSGNRPAQRDLPIRQPIAGTLHASFKLFTSLEGQLLDGIESMLREPHGCFEQTSSTVYPNIFILKYLRSTGKSNPGIEQKAMDYLTSGYKRLTGFETAQHGFEWFGHTPPHEALTAYGLMEFTDLKAFIDVDPDLLQRTKKFLLGRRDGKGGFKQGSNHYFAPVPQAIANTYIVYAFTQAGMGGDIIPEYNAAVKDALESGDGYRLSMMALAASNIQHQSDYNRLIAAANQKYQQDKLISGSSMVNAGGVSARVETVALYAQALMRDPAHASVEVVSGLINLLLQSKSYYGYGSTQSTVLALQAILAFAKFAGKVVADSQVSLIINDKLPGLANPAALLNEGNNTIAIQYNKEQVIPYSFEVSYHTLVPSNSEKAPLQLSTTLRNTKPTTGQTTRLDIAVTNKGDSLLPMAIAKIGIPAGLSLQPWQLKELIEKEQVAYYELFDNWLVLYWMGFNNKETKTIHLDLKAEIPGTYKGKAGHVYLYYTPEHAYWQEGVEAEISQ